MLLLLMFFCFFLSFFIPPYLFTISLYHIFIFKKEFLNKKNEFYSLLSFWCSEQDLNPYFFRRRETFYPIKLSEHIRRCYSTSSHFPPNLFRRAKYKSTFASPFSIILSSSPSIANNFFISILS